MLKTIAGLAIGAFVLRRTSPDTYNKVVTVLNDAVTIASDVCTATRGQVSAYTAEAAADAQKRLQAVDPNAVRNLRALLDGTAPSQPAQHPAPRRAVRRP